MENYIFEVLFAFLGAIIVGVIILTGNNATDQDSKSGWRKSLYDLSSQDYMTIEDIYRLRASLRYMKYNKTVKFSFNYLSNHIIDFCDQIISNKELKTVKSYVDNHITYRLVDNQDKEMIRIYSRYLLIIHQEKNSKKIYFIHNQLKTENEDKIEIDTVKQIKLLKENEMNIDARSKCKMEMELNKIVKDDTTTIKIVQA